MAVATADSLKAADSPDVALTSLSLASVQGCQPSAEPVTSGGFFGEHDVADPDVWGILDQVPSRCRGKTHFGKTTFHYCIQFTGEL